MSRLCVSSSSAFPPNLAPSSTSLASHRHDPLYALFLLTGIIGTFKSYPTLADPGLFLSMTSIFPEIFPCASPMPFSFPQRNLTEYPRPALPHRNIPPALALRIAPSPLPPPLAYAGYRQRQLLLRIHSRVRVFKRGCNSRCPVGRDADRHWKGRRRICCGPGVGYDCNDVGHTDDNSQSSYTPDPPATAGGSSSGEDIWSFQEILYEREVDGDFAFLKILVAPELGVVSGT